MSQIAIQISPEAKQAYFADYLNVARQEIMQVIGDLHTEYFKSGLLEFFLVNDEAVNLQQILRLSFVQGIYAKQGDLLKPLDSLPDFRLHEDFVFGSKFKGKTNERLTQMLINVGLAAIDAQATEGIRLLDPMCGRATTLLWAMRYGIDAKGIEQDAKALVDVQRNIKKWTKLHRQKHKLSEGFIGGSKKRSTGKFLDFSADESHMRIVTGDARKADQIFRKDKFNLIVSDLPYGVQHFTTNKTRNPIDVIEQSIEAWKKCLKKSGAVVLAYNRYNPKREALLDVFSAQGFKAQGFSVEHRMSESIVRDVVVLKLTDQ